MSNHGSKSFALGCIAASITFGTSQMALNFYNIHKNNNKPSIYVETEAHKNANDITLINHVQETMPNGNTLQFDVTDTIAYQGADLKIGLNEKSYIKRYEL